MVERLSAAPIPFEELVIPSGMIDMRGFPDGRLRDASGLVGSAEYRWYISAYLDATLFVDVGTVAGPRFAGFDGTRWFPSYGAGLPLLPASGRPLGGARGRRHPDRLRARGRLAASAVDGSVLTMGTASNAYWSRSAEDVARELGSDVGGLGPEEAARRLTTIGRNVLAPERALSSLRLLYEQVKSPLILILVFAAVVSIVAGEYTDSAVVLAIMVTSTGVGFWRERGARDAIARLRDRLTIETEVIRGGVQRRISAADVVPGDLVVLSAGALVPADGLLWEATDLHVNEAILTGETFPAEKRTGPVDAGAPLAARANSVFMGTNVRAGTARVLVVSTGKSTAFGEIAGRLRLRPPETEFDRGVRQFGVFLTSAMTVLVIAVFAVNMLLARPVVEALLFSIALAVGLSPELLPAILNVVLAQSAAALSKKGVLVKRLAAIENLGSMDVLCTDKTGTLTEGVVHRRGRVRLGGPPFRRGARPRGPQRGTAERPGQSDRRGAAARRPRRDRWKARGDPLRLRAQAAERGRALRGRRPAADERRGRAAAWRPARVCRADRRSTTSRALASPSGFAPGARTASASSPSRPVPCREQPRYTPRRRMRPDARGLRRSSPIPPRRPQRARWSISPRWASGSR